MRSRGFGLSIALLNLLGNAVKYTGAGARPTPRLLVADGSRVNQKLLRLMLARRGYRNVDRADNGALALEASENRAYSLLLLDCEMPRATEFLSWR